MQINKRYIHFDNGNLYWSFSYKVDLKRVSNILYDPVNNEGFFLTGDKIGLEEFFSSTGKIKETYFYF